ncbi:MAG TPA: hypothetical protein VFE30_06550 [Anaeromyxobacteraceae bacterium]|jgi:hypothetical protein|nr:hypothetical protein [Anaeromyxobacteraceae bacterium]
MRKLLLASSLALSTLPVAARSQVSAGISINIPVPTFQIPVAPPLVVVQPGVQVVEGCDHEVFQHDDYWWLRQNGRWYRTRDRRQGWVFVEDRAVPAPLYRLPPGRYKHWRHEQWKEARRERRQDDKELRRDEKRERKAWKEDREEEHGHGRGHGRGHEDRD